MAANRGIASLGAWTVWGVVFGGGLFPTGLAHSVVAEQWLGPKAERELAFVIKPTRQEIKGLECSKLIFTSMMHASHIQLWDIETSALGFE